MMSSDLMTFDKSKLPLKIQISECMKCGFVFNDKAVDEQTLNQFYTNDNYYYTEGSFGTGGSDLSRYEKYVHFLKPFLRHTDNIVDVGCGKGQFVKYLMDSGYAKVRGVELDKRMVEIALQQCIPVHEGSAFGMAFDADSIDLIIYTHVFEHLMDPNHVIRHANEYLKNNGYLFIEVPDASKYSEARVFDFFWLTTIEHINHFSSHYLEILLKNQGFELIAKSELNMPYNNPSLHYPSLKMIFRKNEGKKRTFYQPAYHEQLRNKIYDHINFENNFMAKHRSMIQLLKDTKANLYIWGIGREFFILATFTELLNCNIKALLDKNQDKHGKTIDGIKIMSPELLKRAEPNSTLLLTSVFNKRQMLDYISAISFTGSVRFID